MKTVVLDQTLSTADAVGVARQGWKVQVAPAAIARVQASRDRVDAALARGVPIYGINTGFGSLSRMRIGDDQLRDLQSNLVRSHAAGICDPLPNEVVRAMLVVLAASLCRGLSGVRPAVIESVVALLNAGITPVVPSVGSVGASGDLAPLAHAALVLIGEGEAFYQNERITGGRALQLAGLQAVELAPKEGLALLNGTHLMAGELALLVERSSLLFDAAVLSTACSIDACRASHGFLDPRLYKARGHHGPVLCAQALAQLLQGSEIVESHRENDPRVQDPYSMRCSAIVLGSVADLLGSVRTRVDHELQAVSDNPLVFDDGSIVSGGNFHGMPVAIPLDTLAIGLAHLAGIAERRVYHMVSAFDEQAHLRPFLSPTPGLNSGYMVAQYSAAAACNELAHLAAPASVYNLSTCAGMEDYNSFGPRSAAKARRAVDLVQRVIAIELVCAAQAMEAHRPLRSGQGVEAVVSIVRTKVPVLESDRPPSPEIEAVARMIEAGQFHGLVEGRLW
jgi:histidine ammonia-lyase